MSLISLIVKEKKLIMYLKQNVSFPLVTLFCDHLASPQI